MAGDQVMKPNLKSHPGNRPNKLLSVDELKTFNTQHECAIEYLVAFIDDVLKILPRSLYSVADSNLDKKTLKNRFRTEGLAFATLTLPKLSAGLFQYLETGSISYPSFKIMKDTGHPAFLSGLFRLAYRENEYQVEAIRLIYQISVMFKKLKGPYPESVLSKQLADFVRTDEELGNLDCLDSPETEDILEQACAEISLLFRGFNVDSVFVKPKPGPGATNTPVAKHMRYRPHVLYTQIDTTMPYYEWFVVHPYDVVHQTAYYQELYKNPVAEQRARFKWVYKRVGQARGICIEENEVQYLQQAFKRAIYDWCDKHPLTKGRINFFDQSVNALLALLASISLLYGTIDMSEASDRIWRLLVFRLFKDTDLVPYLDALSTRWIDFPGHPEQPSMKCQKFAPMGSGLCFPVMSIVHWALVRAIMRLRVGHDKACENVYVFGDDIIVPSDSVEAVYEWLPRFGMKLNQSKSYYRSHFRESCGVHAYNGIDITPVFIKHLPIKHSYKIALSCLDVESQFFKKGFTSVAALLEKDFRHLYNNFEVPTVHPNSCVFGFKRDLDTAMLGKLAIRGKDEWGNSLIRVRVVKPKVTGEAPPTQEECYLRHVLTSDVKHEVGGNPESFEAVWKRLALPSLWPRTSIDKCLTRFIDIQDPRSISDIQKEHNAFNSNTAAPSRKRFGSKRWTKTALRNVGSSPGNVFGRCLRANPTNQGRLCLSLWNRHRVTRRYNCRGCASISTCFHDFDCGDKERC